MRIAIVGPTYPYRGGIAYHTTEMVKQFRKMGHEVLFVSFTRQYPQILFPGKDDRDPTNDAPRTETQYLLDSINPFSWIKTANRIAEFNPEILILPWWHAYWTPQWTMINWRLKQLNRKLKLYLVCHNVLPHGQ